MIPPLDFSWVRATDLTKNNLKELGTILAENQHFEVTHENNIDKLEIVENKSIFDRIWYYFNKDDINKEVKRLVNDTIVQLANGIPDKLAEDNKKVIQDLFFDHLALFPQEIFDRNIFKDEALEDTKLLPKILNPNLDKKPEDYISETERKLERRVEKAILGLRFGSNLKAIDAGASGSYFVRDHKMKIIGVFKPGQEESTNVNTPKLGHRILNAIKSIFSSISPIFWPSVGYISEGMTSQLADHLNLDVVPRSTILKMKSDQFVSAKAAGMPTEEVGSFQIFAKETRSAKERFKLSSGVFLKYSISRSKDQILKDLSQRDFEEMAVLDGLILNKDRHFENWLVKENADPLDGTHRIAPIDQQLGFPKINPPVSDANYKKSQNLWKLLPQADFAFSDEMKRRIKLQMRGENLRQLLDNLQKVSERAQVLDPQAKTFRDSDGINSQEFAFKQRVAVLLIAQTKDITIHEYAKIRSLDEMIEFTKGTVNITDLDDLNHYLAVT